MMEEFDMMTGTDLALGDEFAGDALPALDEPGVKLTPPQKAALIITALGPEAAGPIIERISDNHLRSFARAYAKLETIKHDELVNVVQEFMGRLNTDDDTIKGGFEQARALLSEFKTSDEIVLLMEDIGAPGGRSVWQKLEEANERELAEYVCKQHPQTIAVIVSKLGTDKSAFVMSSLSDEASQEVLMRLMKPLDVGEAAMRVLCDTIEREFLKASSGTKTERKPGQMIGTIMNNMPSDKRDALLEHVNKEAPEMVPEIQKYMLTFQDFAERVPPNAVANITRQVDEDVLLKAIKFGQQNAPSTVTFLMENISQRMASQYEEQLEGMEKVPSKDGEIAQRAIMGAVRQLEADGEIKLNEIIMEAEEE